MESGVMGWQYTTRGAISYFPRIMADADSAWTFKLPEPRDSDIHRAYHYSLDQRKAARVRLELLCFSSAESKLHRDLDRNPTADEVAQEALGMFRAIERADDPRMTPAEAEFLDGLRDSGKIQFEFSQD